MFHIIDSAEIHKSSNALLRVSLQRCWVERDSDKSLLIELWNQFCPKFKWVAPRVVENINTWLQMSSNDYLNVAWDTKSAIHGINFRNISQFYSKFEIEFVFIFQSIMRHA